MYEIRTIRNYSALKIRCASERGLCREVTAINLSRRDETKTKNFGNEEISKVLISRSASQIRFTWASPGLFMRSLSPSVEEEEPGISKKDVTTNKNTPFLLVMCTSILNNPGDGVRRCGASLLR